MTVDAFLQSHPEFELVKVRDEVIESTADGIFFDGCKTENIHFARRFYPHKSKGEGQFMAVLHNKNEYFETTKKAGKEPSVKLGTRQNKLGGFCTTDAQPV